MAYVDYSCKTFVIIFETAFSYHGSWQQLYCPTNTSALQTDQFNDSCDEDKETELQDENLIPTRNAGVENSDSDTDSSEDKHDSNAASGATPSDNSLSQNTVEKLKHETELCGKP